LWRKKRNVPILWFAGISLVTVELFASWFGGLKFALGILFTVVQGESSIAFWMATMGYSPRTATLIAIGVSNIVACFLWYLFLPEKKIARWSSLAGAIAFSTGKTLFAGKLYSLLRPELRTPAALCFLALGIASLALWLMKRSRERRMKTTLPTRPEVGIAK
jgi:heme/copper-type cytochrome/quinol oxidase subunit 4